MSLINMIQSWMRISSRNILNMYKQVEETKILSAKILMNQIASQGLLLDIQSAEFKVFSQFGEDGIIQYLIRQTGIPSNLYSFIEFGVETYEEANTRFLLINNNWRGLIFDGIAANIAQVKASQIFWRYNLTAVEAFIDADNINELIMRNGFKGEIGLLSIDIDGNDYWVWEKISAVSPVIVIVEYNSVFGRKHAITVPYDPSFIRSKAHFSNLYWGCSLKALELLGKRKGYALVGSNNAGNNAFFVRRDRLSGLLEMKAEEAYVESNFRESRDPNGNLNYLAWPERYNAIRDLPVYDIESDIVISLKDLQ